MELRKQPQAIAPLIREVLERMTGALESRIVEVRARQRPSSRAG